MATTFKFRGRWRAQVIDQAGTRHTKDFPTRRQAQDWAAGVRATDTEHQPELGGPTHATLAQMLRHYAQLYTVNKGGADQELLRISRYLCAAGLPVVRRERLAEGKYALVERSPAQLEAALTSKWREYLGRRRAQRARSSEVIGRLAIKKVSQVSRADIDLLMSTMEQDGASKSTVQKEIALLKHAFTQAIGRWGWAHLKNPCLGAKLGRSELRLLAPTEN